MAFPKAGSLTMLTGLEDAIGRRRVNTRGWLVIFLMIRRFLN